MKQDLVIVSNSPGELSALVRPLVKAFYQHFKEAQITLVLTPCQYASGNEVEFAKSIGINQIVSSEEYQKWILRNQSPKNINFSENGLVIFTGGDLLHCVMIAKKLKYKAVAYLGEYISWQKSFELFFVPDQEMYNKFANKVDKNKLINVGNLMVDSIFYFLNKDALTNKYKLDSSKRTIAFMPGSRTFQINYLIPYYEKIFTLLANKLPDTNLVLSLSPFVNMHEIIRAKSMDTEITYEDNLQYLKGNNYKVLISKDIFAPAADLVVTIPGTNTAQIAVFGCPMLVIFPLDRPEVIPMEGLAHYIGKIPILGNLMKKLAAYIINKKTKYFALPNIKANKEIVPELRGNISPEMAVSAILELVHNPNKLLQMRTELKTSLGQNGAAENIVKQIKKLTGW